MASSTPAGDTEAFSAPPSASAAESTVDPVTARHLPKFSEAQVEVIKKQVALQTTRSVQAAEREKEDADKAALAEQLTALTVEFEQANARAERALSERSRFGGLLGEVSPKLV